ncbi:MAG: cell division protein FtsL [Myxococcales bacterium]|nr:cell division protein FtsL [Myxococcales bacterium]
MKGRFLALWTVAVLATAAAFVVHLTVRFETVRLGYAIGAKRKERDKLLEEKRMLAVEAASLKSAVRVETIARGVLKMDAADAQSVITVDRRTARRTAGAVR